MRLTLCVMTWNELEGCRHDIPRLDLDQFEEVFAVDGGSTDGTREYLESRGIPVHLQDIPGYNYAYITAFRRCTTDALVLFHPKGSVDAAETLNFRPYLEQGYELVVASRIIDGGVNEEDDRLFKPRKWFVIGLAIVLHVLWKREGNTVWDVLNGFRAMRREAFWAIDPLEHGLSIDLEMVLRSYRKRLKRVEFPVTEKARLCGETHFKAFPTGRRLLRYLLFELTRGI